MKSIAAILLVSSGLFGITEDYSKTKQEIEQAVEQRNFYKVKNLLTDLMPLIKEDIKTDKKALNELKKVETEEVLTDIENTINQKSEIYDKLNHILKVSPAAVRGRSSQIIQLLEEYGEIRD